METKTVNWLLIRAIGILVAYCAIGFFTPKPYISSLIGMGAFLVGGIVFAQYAEMTYNILFRKARGDYGGHIAILGAAALGFGSMYSGFFRIIWGYFGSPVEWTGTAISSFGLFMTAFGSYLIARAPDAVRGNSMFPSGFWRKAGILFIVIAAFVAGTHFASFQ